MDTKWLLARMEARALSIAQLARIVERDRAAMSRIVNGEQPFPLWMAEPVARAIGVNPLELLSHAGIVQSGQITSATVMPVHAVGMLADLSEPSPLLDRYPKVTTAGASDTLISVQVDDERMDRVIPAGASVIVDYSVKKLADKSIGLFIVDGKPTFARWNSERKGGFLSYESYNPRLNTSIPVDGEPVVVGRVVKIALPA